MFTSLPEKSFHRIKVYGKKSEYYQNLIQVNVTDETYIFDLDSKTKEPTEIDFIEGIELLTNPETYIPFGTTTKRVIKDKTKY